jgi:hypothetical protein
LDGPSLHRILKKTHINDRLLWLKEQRLLRSQVLLHQYRKVHVNYIIAPISLTILIERPTAPKRPKMSLTKRLDHVLIFYAIQSHLEYIEIRGRFK